MPIPRDRSRLSRTRIQRKAEYQDCISEIENVEESRKSHQDINWKIEPIPPDPKDFGISVEYSEPYEYTPIIPLVLTPEPLLPHCSFCSSINLTKLSSLDKATKIWAFGLFGAGDVGKTYKCNNCGGKF